MSPVLIAAASGSQRLPVRVVPADGRPESVEAAIDAALWWLGFVPAAVGDRAVVEVRFTEDARWSDDAKLSLGQLSAAGVRLGQGRAGSGRLLVVAENMVDGTPTHAQATLAGPSLVATVPGMHGVFYVVGTDGRAADLPTPLGLAWTRDGALVLHDGWELVGLGSVAAVRPYWVG